MTKHYFEFCGISMLTVLCKYPCTNTAPVVLKQLLQLALPEYSNILLRKLNVKLLQVSILCGVDL